MNPVIYTNIQMIRQILVLTIVFLSLLQVGAQSAQKEIPTIGLNQIALGKLYKVDNFKSYHLINVNSIEKKYLFFSLKTQEVYQGFNLSLTIYKQGTQTPLVRCVKQQVDSCYLPKQQVFLNQTLFIVVQCQSGEELEYKIRTYWSDLEHLIVGTEARFMFSEKDQKQIYHLELEGKQFKELRIIIKPETRRYPFDKIKMYGTFGAKSNPSASFYDFKSFPLWEDAEGIYLYRSQLKNLTMNLILYGETKTVYTMRCEIVNKTHADLGLNEKIYEYMQKEERYTYHLKFKDQKNSYFYDNYVFRFAVFTGDLDIKFYKDQHKTQPVDDLVSYAYMGDMQYAFNNKTSLQQKMPNGLYVQVESTKRVSTYMLEFQGRGKSQSLQLHEHIYQFLPIQKTQLAYIRVGKFIDKTIQNRFRLVFTDIPVMGRISIEFRVCKKDLSQCLGANYAQNSDKILTQVKQVGSKITYTLQLAQGMFNSVNVAEQNALVIVAMTSMIAEGQSFSAVEYNVGNRPEYLRQNKPIQSYVRKGEFKTYKYVCQDPLIKKVRIHINKINGCFDTFGLRRLPTQQDLKNPTHGKIIGSIAEFSQNLLQDPIVLLISGSDSATYSIVVQTITDSEQQLSYITLSEDVEFKMKIASNKYEIFQIVPISASIYFNYKATGPVHVCLLNEDMVCIQKNIPVLENQGKVDIQTFYNRKAYVKVRNPSNRVVEVKSIFHSRRQEHCELIKMGHLARQTLTEGKCLYTVIDELKDFEVMLVHEEYGQFIYQTVICSQLVNIPKKLYDQQRFYISKDLLQKNCEGNAEYTFTFVVIGNISRMADGRTQAVQKLNAKYLIQYINSIVVIPDGVGYHSSEVTTERAIKKFSYGLMNMVNTSIMVTTRSKLIFLVKVVESSSRETTTINFNDYQFTSPSDKYYFLDSIHLTISGEQLAKSTCKQCQLLIYLYSQQTVGQIVDYTIQVTQNFEVLEEGVQRKNYLTQNSKAFYSYNAKQEGQILIQLSDNNQNCAQLYVSRSQYPDQNNYDKKSFDGQIIYENKKKEPSTLYISVRARVNCAYSVGASLIKGSIKIKKLERGVMSPLTLKSGQVRYFTFKHVSSSPFKILSLHKYGNIQFYLNKTSPEEVGQKLKQNKLNYESFSYKSQQKNRLTLLGNNIYFCNGCFYVVAAVATKPTDSSIFLADQQIKIPITEDKVINDILPYLNSFTKAQFYPLQNGIVQVKVHSGKLSVQIKYKEQSISNTFEKQNTKQTFNFNLKHVTGYYGTATATFKALQPNTVYSLRIYSQQLKSKELETRTQTIVNPSEPTYFYVDGVKQTVLKGYLKSRQDKIFISFFSSDKQLLRLMNLTATLNGKPADISRDKTRNVLSIGFIDSPNLSYEKGVPYQLIFSLQNQTMSLIAMQTQQTSLLPQNLEVLVAGIQTYDIYPEGQFLLDIFECRGTASLAYSKTRSGLQKQKQKILDAVAMPDQPHAVRIEQGYTNMLLRVTSSLSLVRWLPISRSEEKGLGYYLYKAGTLKYDSVFGNIDFTVQPLSRTSQKTKTKIHDIKYNLYISNSEQDLKQASLCERYLPASVLEYRSIHQQIFTSSFKFSIDKNKLNEKYKESQNLFAVIVADLTLKIPDGSQEYYRFIYNQQEIPKEIFTPSKLQTFHFVSLSVFILLLILALFVLAWLCTKVFVPMIGRLRNSMLVQQNGLQTSKDKDIEIKDQHLEPPPSSERQNIAKEEAPPTQEAMS